MIAKIEELDKKTVEIATNIDGSSSSELKYDEIEAKLRNVSKLFTRPPDKHLTDVEEAFKTLKYKVYWKEF